MDPVWHLRKLTTAITDPAAEQDAFELWNGVKSVLSAEQRVQILTAWNQYLRTGKDRGLRDAIDQVIRQVST